MALGRFLLYLLLTSVSLKFNFLGKHIPVGLPKMIVKEQNSDNISIINDVAMNPVFLIVNKPIEYSSTVSIS